MLTREQKINATTNRPASRWWFRFVILIGLAFLAPLQTRADEPQIMALLSSSETGLGQPVQLEIRVTGASGGNIPDAIPVDGLAIQRTGTSREFRMNGFKASSSYVYSYLVTPERTGTFKIPPLTITAGGTSLRTSELTLRVVDDAATAAQARTPGGNVGIANRLASLEVIVPSKGAYVGEMIPLQMRLTIDGQARFESQSIIQGPVLNAQGFTVQKLTQPTQDRIVENGRRKFLFVYKTAIAAAKPGKFEIGPATLKTLFQLPRPGGRRFSPSDVFGMDDGFDAIFRDPFEQLAPPQEITIQSQPITLEVKPLPPNPPPGFSGAVGNFTMTTDANPKTAQVGDPITVTTTISGRGNFDRVSAPGLVDESGWHKYPPSSKFQQDDDVGLSGTKTFETVITSNDKKKEIPPVVFSYFDPQKGQYLTLRGEAIPVQIEGGAINPPPVVPAPPTAPATTTAPAQASTPTPAKAEDILYQITNWPQTASSFTPIYLQSNFWMIQIVPLLALLGFIGWKVRQLRLSDREAQRRAELQHEAGELQRKLRRGDTSSREYYAEAARAVQLKTALARNINPNTVDAKVAAAAFKLDDTMRRQLESLFDQNDELRYSGQQHDGSAVSPNERQEVLELIEHLKT